MKFKKLWLIPALILVAGGIAYAATRSSPPADLDYSLSHVSEAARYKVSLIPSIEPVPVVG